MAILIAFAERGAGMEGGFRGEIVEGNKISVDFGEGLGVFGIRDGEEQVGQTAGFIECKLEDVIVLGHAVESAMAEVFGSGMWGPLKDASVCR